MKRCLVILIVLCCISGRLYAQSQSAAIDSLVKFGVIKASQRQALEKDLKAYGHVSYRVTVLRALFDIILQQDFHIDPHQGAISVIYRGDNMSKQKRDSINTSLRLLLKNINKAGLLSDRVYTSTLTGIDSNKYIAKEQLIGNLVEISSRLEELAPDKLLPVAEQLHKNGIVNDSSFLRLQNDIKNRKIESAFQLNSYCSLDKTFDMVNYTGDTAVWLEKLHHDMAAMLPGLDFTNFRCTSSVVIDSSFGMGPEPETKFKVSLVCHGRIYKYANTSLDLPTGKGKMPLDNTFAAGFFRIFNKILTDEHSPLRLHLLMSDHASTGDDDLRRFALIALRDTQFDVFARPPCMLYMLASPENYDNTLTSGRVDSAIAEWKQIGIFAHLSDQEIEKATDDAQTADLSSVDDLLSYFPGVTYALRPFPDDSIRPYASLLNHLAQITRGVFNPTAVSQRKINGGIRLQYSFDGKIHTFMFKKDYWYFDKRFPSFLEQLGRENGLPGDFYEVPYLDAIIYLTKQQYAYAVKNKLLDFDTATRHRRIKGN